MSLSAVPPLPSDCESTPDPAATAEATRLIDEAIAVSETAVLEVGNAVGQIVSAAREQVDDSSQLAAQFSSDSKIANAIDEQNQAMSGFISWLTQRLSDQRDVASEVMVHLGEIAGAGDRINNIAQEAKIVTINARIEAARLGAQGKPFTVIAEQLADLAEGVREANLMIEKLAVTMQDSMPRMARITDELADDAEEFQSSYACALDRVRSAQEELNERVYATLQGGENRSEQMLADSQKILNQLQFQDPMAQSLRKVAHLVTGEAPHEHREPTGDVSAEQGPTAAGDEVEALDDGEFLLF